MALLNATKQTERADAESFIDAQIAACCGLGVIRGLMPRISLSPSMPVVVLPVPALATTIRCGALSTGALVCAIDWRRTDERLPPLGALVEMPLAAPLALRGLDILSAFGSTCPAAAGWTSCIPSGVVSPELVVSVGGLFPPRLACGLAGFLLGRVVDGLAVFFAKGCS
jgi:hypothetical protein